MPQASTSPRPLSVTYRAAGSLKPDPRNARTHPKRQVDQIIASMRKFGFTNPIVVYPDGTIIAGHGRLLAAKAMVWPRSARGVGCGSLAEGRYSSCSQRQVQLPL